MGDDRGARLDTNSFNATAIRDPGDSAVDQRNARSLRVGGITYSYVPVCIRGEGIPGEQFYGCGDQMACGQNDDGLFFNWIAHLPDGSIESPGTVCFGPDDDLRPAQQVTQAVVLRAFQRIPLPDSEVVIQPPGGETLVNLDTIFSTEADGFTRTIGLLGHRVDLDITPAEFRWVNGDGTVQVTDWAGKPWAKGTPLREFITHRYDDADRSVAAAGGHDLDGAVPRRRRGVAGRRRDGDDHGDPFDLAVLSAEPHWPADVRGILGRCSPRYAASGCRRC